MCVNQSPREQQFGSYSNGFNKSTCKLDKNNSSVVLICGFSFLYEKDSHVLLLDINVQVVDLGLFLMVNLVCLSSTEEA